MKMFLAGQWTDGHTTAEVSSPYDGSPIDTVPQADRDDVDRALAGAVAGAAVMRRLPAYERSQVLRRAAELLRDRRDAIARLISREEGKVLAESRAEVDRAVQTVELSAEEAKRLGGEVLPLDGTPGAADRLGFTLRVPCGVVVSITPFNFPLNLVCHKVAPALAAGNAVVLKPASATPLTALTFVGILLEAGLPPEGIACLTGPGAALGEWLCSDSRVRKISFTGSREVGDRICRIAGAKRVTLELGGNSPIVVMDDADLARVARLTAATGFSNAGQSCISAQRVVAMQGVYGDLLDRLKAEVETIRTGDPLDPSSTMGPLIRESDANRVTQWVDEAVAGGARLVCSGQRRGSLLEPMVLADTQPTMRIARDELFGPAVAVSAARDIDEAIALVNGTPYGLSAAIFTQSLDRAMRFARRVESGNIHINWGPAWRADAMPYGGLKESGFGKEGPRYAIEAMTELKTVVIHGIES